MGKALALLIVVAALAGNSPVPHDSSDKHESARTEERTAISRNGTSLTEAKKPKQEIAPCTRGDEDRQSELCAQWKAADAAAKAAKAADDTVVIGGIGLALATFTTLAAVAAAVFAYFASDHTQKANRISENSARAWVALNIKPNSIEPYKSGSYFRVNFTAQNTGDTIAKNFRFLTEIFFLDDTRETGAIHDAIREKIDQWKLEYATTNTSCLIPNDIEIIPFWDDRQPPDLSWVNNSISGSEVMYPIFIAAVFYRTTFEPNLVQLSWRSWYICSYHKNRKIAHWIEKDKFYGPDDICAEPFRNSLVHEEYESLAG